MSDELVLIEKRDRSATMTLVRREVFAPPDAAEGPRAFMEKREPRFSNQ
jgi:hypothetical protein